MYHELLTRKAWLATGGHQTDLPSESTYSSVVSRDSVCIAFTLAALNDLDVLATDVHNAYLNAPTKEHVYTIAGGPEVGHAISGCPVLILRALYMYGLKSIGARWKNHMAQTLGDEGFHSTLADPNVEMIPRRKPNRDMDDLLASPDRKSSTASKVWPNRVNLQLTLETSRRQENYRTGKPPNERCVVHQTSTPPRPRLP